MNSKYFGLYRATYEIEASSDSTWCHQNIGM
ncbi:Uncharacterised protein [Mycobacteroides abscessus subsp. abscessus]|nr:Uncharacterised protein [Mycobacteroides abscessus subsp. abscessus]